MLFDAYDSYPAFLVLPFFAERSDSQRMRSQRIVTKPDAAYMLAAFSAAAIGLAEVERSDSEEQST